MFVDNLRVGSLGSVEEFTRRRFTACILRYRNEFKILVFQFIVNSLPT